MSLTTHINEQMLMGAHDVVIMDISRQSSKIHLDTTIRELCALGWTHVPITYDLNGTRRGFPYEWETYQMIVDAITPDSRGIIASFVPPEYPPNLDPKLSEYTWALLDSIGQTYVVSNKFNYDPYPKIPKPNIPVVCMAHISTAEYAFVLSRTFGSPVIFKTHTLWDPSRGNLAISGPRLKTTEDYLFATRFDDLLSTIYWHVNYNHPPLSIHGPYDDRTPLVDALRTGLSDIGVLATSARDISKIDSPKIHIYTEGEYRTQRREGFFIVESTTPVSGLQQFAA